MLVIFDLKIICCLYFYVIRGEQEIENLIVEDANKPNHIPDSHIFLNKSYYLMAAKLVKKNDIWSFLF